ncbi:hypothetical protein AQI88_28590 [Streptomyces cellostaticus]|uniref:Uncharacterized protein n=1 Tax=Streptomyces cellostaticus TaxID=67285 RepID=A0A117PUS3_9ACTN|nr:hypothetical protein [Streptomyces cellostaticus]KUM93080.1 hypothetical protein AQI88_28590 [Streptomyces cellostaticus]GHI06108.1 hypothetical protein Scel_44290 [Streptomyces cellostaticus]
MFSKKEAHLVVLNDLDEARAALQEALRGAEGEETAAGLRRALDIVDGIGDGLDPRVRWAQQALAEAKLDPKAQEVASVKALRDALPGLSLVTAVELVRKAQAA